MTAILAVPSADLTSAHSTGYYVDAVASGKDGKGYWYDFPGDLTGTTEDVIIGYKYDYVIEFPEFFYKENQAQSDFTSYLSVSRIKFAVGLTGSLGFKLNTRGRSEWYDIQPVVEADYYTANSGPLAARYFFNVPVHQRAANFKIKAFSDLPYPVCMNMVTWEGNYTPRYYKRS